MKIRALILVSMFLSGLGACASNHKDMTGFVIDDYAQVDKPCSKNSQCKVLELGYFDCANYRYMVYSAKTISGINEKRLKELTLEYTKRESEKFQRKNCVLMSGAPSKGVCYKRGCEIVKTWR